MIPKIFFRSSLALLFVSAPLYGQEADAAAGGEDVFVESSTLLESPLVDAGVEPEPASFFFPGGYGFLPEVIAPGAGLYARPPIAFSLTLQSGYSDNIYNRQDDKQGSATTQASGDINLLMRTPRSFLSLGASAGALYYWDKERNQLSPVGSLSAAYAYSVTPRLQLTGRVNGGYYNQPNLSMPNAPTVNSGDYFNLNSLFDLSYRWTPVFSTVTSFGANTQIFRDRATQDSNYVEWFVGESFRYLLTPRLTGVAEVRFSDIRYDGEVRNSSTESVMAGFDWMMTPRLTSTLRGGISFRQFEVEGADDAASPYFESVIGYRYGRGSLLQWNARFGFEEARDPFLRNQTFRTGITVSQVFTPRINGSINLSYAHENNERMRSGVFYGDDSGEGDLTQQLVSGSARLEFIATRSLTFFGIYTRAQNISDFQNSDYTRNEVSIGASYHF